MTIYKIYYQIGSLPQFCLAFFSAVLSCSFNLNVLLCIFILLIINCVCLHVLDISTISSSLEDVALLSKCFVGIKRTISSCHQGQSLKGCPLCGLSALSFYTGAMAAAGHRSGSASGTIFKAWGQPALHAGKVILLANLSHMSVWG